MNLQKYIEQVLSSFDGYGGEVFVNFELCLDENLEVVNEGPVKVKFGVRR
jgi:hypothetical protein